MSPIKTEKPTAKLNRRLRQRNRQVEAHRALVAPIACHYAAHSPEGRDDLEQVGLLGLIRAAELYDPKLAVPFAAYARRHVRGAILHYLRDTAPLVRQPRRLQERSWQRQRLARSLSLQLGREATAAELCNVLGLSLEQWQDLQQQPWQQRLWLEQQDQCADTAGMDAVSIGVLDALQALQPRQRLVVQAVVLEGCSLRHVSTRLGSSPATVHRLLHRGLHQLRSQLDPPSGVRAC